MSERAKALYDQIMALPSDERADLLEAVDAADAPPDPYPDEEAWRAELDRRLQSVEDGTAELIPWNESIARVTRELERRRAARSEGEPS